jgi:hypothetical protein
MTFSLMSLKYNSLCNKLIQEAFNSPIQFRLAACLLQNGKLVNAPKCNVTRNYCRGHMCGSLHAEARVLVSHFGNQINWDRKFGWRFQTVSRKKGKEK